ncbi:MAG: hypothetical protein JXQ83_10270, partial [Candidatus Glassbacteria bacterium]|nr:hypothetical protein [Candidatus Glassbacteria bacterium]
YNIKFSCLTSVKTQTGSLNNNSMGLEDPVINILKSSEETIINFTPMVIYGDQVVKMDIEILLQYKYLYTNREIKRKFTTSKGSNNQLYWLPVVEK